MKTRIHYTLTLAAIVGLALTASTGSAALIIDVDGANGVELAGTLTTIQGSSASFPEPPGITNYASVVTAGDDKTATTHATLGNNDFYVNFSAGALGTVAVADARYVEVFYSLSGDWIGTNHQLLLAATVADPGPAGPFVPFDGSGISNADGAHSFVIDLLGDDNPEGWGGNWTRLRWDFFNSAGNGDNSFTIDKIVYGSTIPEPATLGLLSVVGASFLFIRRTFMK